MANGIIKEKPQFKYRKTVGFYAILSTGLMLDPNFLTLIMSMLLLIVMMEEVDNSYRDYERMTLFFDNQQVIQERMEKDYRETSNPKFKETVLYNQKLHYDTLRAIEF